jgi:CubicO group peptidase (beta-lactamase class C family)
VENGVPAGPDTVYRIASISRMITAVAVLQLVQSGKIGLNASVRDYVPELPDKGHRITVEHLLAHLSGLRSCKNRDELFNRKHHLRLVDTLDYFKDDPLLVEPGRRFINTPFGYTLLGLVVERVSSLTFGDYVQKHIFAPAEMKTAGLEDLSAVIPHRARGYILKKDGSLRNSYFVDLSVRYPGDGMVASAEDLARFAIGLLTGRLLDPPTIKIMTTAYRTKSGEQTHYGLGCFVREHNGRRIVGHAGWQPQVATFLLIIPDSHASVVVLANLEQADVKKIALAVADIILGENPAGS